MTRPYPLIYSFEMQDDDDEEEEEEKEKPSKKRKAEDTANGDAKKVTNQDFTMWLLSKRGNYISQGLVAIPNSFALNKACGSRTVSDTRHIFDPV